MSCPNKGYGKNVQSDAYLYAQYSNAPFGLRSLKKCKAYQPTYPSLTPTLSNLSKTSSNEGAYAFVTVTGANFMPNGTTFIKFGAVYIPAIYYSSFELSFTVPLNTLPGTYPVFVVNLYNISYNPGQLLFSPTSISYTVHEVEET